MRIGITGASGFVGNELAMYLAAQNHEVILLQRSEPAVLHSHMQYRHFDLTATTLPNLADIDVLIHAAYIPENNNHSSALNKNGTFRLWEYCQQHNIYFIFLSSMSATPQALSEYGKHKFEIEQQLKDTQALILKLGLVLGRQGLFGRIKKTVERSLLIPLIGGGNQPVQTVYVGDVAKCIEAFIKTKPAGVVLLATTQVYTLQQLFKAIAKAAGRSPVFVPVPYFLAYMGISLIQQLRIPLPVSKENLLGLKQMQAAAPTASSLLGNIHLLSLEESIEQINRKG